MTSFKKQGYTRAASLINALPATNYIINHTKLYEISWALFLEAQENK